MLKIKLLLFLASISAFFVSISKAIYYESQKDRIIIETVINEINGEPLKKEEKKINTNNKIEDKYKIILEIPKINLKKGILSKEDKNNNVDKNVTILDYSVYPGEAGNIYIAAHSGTGLHSYFNNIDKLKTNDIINLYYNKKKYIYSLYDIKLIKKNEKISLISKEKNNLFLITCSQKYKNKYLILYFRGQY